MKERKHLKIVGFVVLLLVFAVSLFLIFHLIEKIVNYRQETPQSPDYTDSGDSRVFYEGAWYALDDDIETVLVLGIDSIETEGDARKDSAQADFLALLVINRMDESFRILHINRDTMTEIAQLNDNGEKYGTFDAQLALAHTYGGEDKLRCRNTVEAVENLLYGMRIDHYMSLTMDAIATVNDSVGGVSVTLEGDFPALGESFVEGATVTLTGADALTFVRWRNDTAEGSNLERMERQRLYIGALFEKFTEESTDNTLDTVKKVNDHLVSDFTANQISNLMQRLQTYTYEGILEMEGEAQLGEEFVEFYADETALQATVVELFYELAE